MSRRMYFWRETLLNLALLGTVIFLIHSEKSWVEHLMLFLLFPILGFRSFALMHEGSHGLLSKSKFLNDCWGVLWGSIALLPHDPWRFNHILHHKWTGNIHRDPSMALVLILPKLPRLYTKTMSFAWQHWIPLTGALQHISFWINSWKLSFSGRSRSLVHWISLVTPAAFVISLFVIAQDSATLFNVAAAYAVFFSGIEIINFPHHLRLRHIPSDQHLPPQKQSSVTRTCLYPKWVSQFIVLNFNYHTEHHYAPHKPWYELPSLHAKLVAENKDIQLDYGLNWILANRHQDILGLIAEPEESSDKTNDIGFRSAAND